MRSDCSPLSPMTGTSMKLLQVSLVAMFLAAWGSNPNSDNDAGAGGGGAAGTGGGTAGTGGGSSGIGGGTSGTGGGVATAPTVTSTSPWNDATDVSLNARISTTFSVPMDPATIT